MNQKTKVNSQAALTAKVYKNIGLFLA